MKNEGGQGNSFDLKMSDQENYLRTLEFRNPEWIPVSVGLAWPLWHKYRKDLEEVVLSHPQIFKDYEKGSKDFDDLIECGVSMHDPQLRANTLEGIEKVYKGNM